MQGQVSVGGLLSSSGGPTALLAPRRHEKAGNSQGAGAGTGDKAVAAVDNWLCLALCLASPPAVSLHE